VGAAYLFDAEDPASSFLSTVVKTKHQEFEITLEKNGRGERI
jgi:hypothetical protein